MKKPVGIVVKRVVKDGLIAYQSGLYSHPYLRCGDLVRIKGVEKEMLQLEILQPTEAIQAALIRDFRENLVA